MKKIMFVLATLSILLVGCGKINSVSVDTESITFTKAGGTSTVLLTANAAWTATSSDALFAIDPTSGDAGTVGVTITAGPNVGSEDINAVVTFTCGTSVATINVVAEADPIGRIVGNFVASGLDAWRLYISSDINASDPITHLYGWTETTNATSDSTVDLNYWATIYESPKLTLTYKNGVYAFKDDNVSRGTIDIDGINYHFWQTAFLLEVSPEKPDSAIGYYVVDAIDFTYSNGTLSANYTLNLEDNNGNLIASDCLAAIGSLVEDGLGGYAINDLIALPVLSKGAAVSKAPRYHKGTYKGNYRKLDATAVKAVKLK